MELYFAGLGLYQKSGIEIPLLQVVEQDASHWLESRGFHITRYDEAHLPSYDHIEKSLARYGKIPCSDTVADLNVRKISGNRGIRVGLEIAGNNKGMVFEIFDGLRTGPFKHRRLKVEQKPTLKDVDAECSNFKRLEYLDGEVRVYSVAQLKQVLRIE